MGEKECALTKHERILVATDGSKNSEAALDQALGFAGTCNSTLYIIHVIDLNPEYMALSPALEKKMKEKAALVLGNAKQKAEAAGIRCQTILNKTEQPYKAIVETAKEHKVDLIVMGSHGNTAVSKLIMGSVTRQVIAHIPCAVLVVPA